MRFIPKPTEIHTQTHYRATQPTHQIQPTHNEPRLPMASHDHPTHGDLRRATITSPTASHDYPWDSYPNPLSSHPANPSNPTDPTWAKTTHGEPWPPHPRRPTSSHNHLTHGDPRLPMSKHRTTAIWIPPTQSLHTDLCHTNLRKRGESVGEREKLWKWEEEREWD